MAIVSLPKRKKDKDLERKEGEAYIRQREKLASRQKLTAKQAGEVLSEREDAARALKSAEEAEKVRLKQEEEARLKAFQKASGSKEAIAEVEGLLVNPPSLRADKKEAVGRQGVVAGLDIPLLPGVAGEGLPGQELAQEPQKALLKTAGLGVAGVGAAPATTAVATKAAVLTTKSAVGGAVATLGVLMVGGKFTDIEGGEMGVLRAEVGRIPGMSSTIQSEVQNGADPIVKIEELMVLHQSVINAERRIKELGIYNVDYRIDNKYRDDMMLMRDARNNILERLRAIENIATYGTAGQPAERLQYGGVR